jgi:hypothetical protein
MEQKRTLPPDLKIVAYLFVIFGLLAVCEVIVSLFARRLSLNLGVLQLPIGIGILNLRRGWRTCALVFLALGLMFVPVFCLGLLFPPLGTVDFRVFGLRVGDASKGIVLAIAVAAFCLMIWQFRVLTRSDIRRLFSLGPQGTA